MKTQHLCLVYFWLVLGFYGGSVLAVASCFGVDVDIESLAYSSEETNKLLAARALIDFDGELPDDRIGLVLHVLLGDKSKTVRRDALFAVEEVLSRTSRPKLAAAIRTDVETSVSTSQGTFRTLALRALFCVNKTTLEPEQFRHWEKQTIIQPMLELSTAKHSDDRLASSRFLFIIDLDGLRQIPSTTIKRLLQDDNDRVRREAFIGLENVAYREPSDEIVTILNELRPTIQKATKSKDPELVRCATRLLKRTKP